MRSILLLLALAGADPEQITQPQLIIARNLPTVVPIAIWFDDQPADQAWVAFLDRWRLIFDANGDGMLQVTEAGRIPPLTNASGGVIRFDDKSADADNDGLVGRDEILAYYRDCEISAIQTLAPQNDVAGIRVSDTLWRLLDIDRDDKLSQGEMAAAPRLLNRWDVNEDECLSFEELSPGAATASLPDPGISWRRDSRPAFDAADTVDLPVSLNSLANLQNLRPRRNMPSGLKMIDRERLRLDLPGVRITVLLEESSVQRIIAAQQYLLGEINLVRGDRPAIDLATIHTDPNLDWLASFVPAADRDGDKQLTEAELKSIVGLLADGAAAQVALSAMFRGRNLFDYFDTNSDNQLDLRELNAARQLTAPPSDTKHGNRASLALADIPLSVTVRLHRGPMSGRFGRLRMARRHAETSTKGPPPTDLPRWFAAMDRNRDQMLSPVEFLGTPSQFERLDRNADDVVSADELE